MRTCNENVCSYRVVKLTIEETIRKKLVWMDFPVTVP